ncbi:MAG: hypothetical protein RBS38_14505 [Bacteroidales bacterium]|jgi:hypothetical protein|nr:hypothetical protein [Bacteroidales bacterium]MDY0388359.1 hypothetical protein [Methanolobus sp.]
MTAKDFLADVMLSRPFCGGVPQLCTRNFNDLKTKKMDIREYFQKEQKGFYRIIATTLTPERGKQLYAAINDWHESELKLLGIADVVGRVPAHIHYDLSLKAMQLMDDKKELTVEEFRELPEVKKLWLAMDVIKEHYL